MGLQNFTPSNNTLFMNIKLNHRDFSNLEGYSYPSLMQEKNIVKNKEVKRENKHLDCLNIQLRTKLNSSIKDNKDSNRILVKIKEETFTVSQREFQCLRLLAHGKRTKGIANFLGISRRTVESYLLILKRKTGASFHGSLADFYWNYFEEKKL